MKYKVVKRFIDKNTKKLHEKGSFYDCSEKRFAEIEKQGKFLEAVPQEKASDK